MEVDKEFAQAGEIIDNLQPEDDIYLLAKFNKATDKLTVYQDDQ